MTRIYDIIFPGYFFKFIAKKDCETNNHSPHEKQNNFLSVHSADDKLYR